jgi:hypothetical protein
MGENQILEGCVVWTALCVNAFSVEHTNALDRAVVRNLLAETPSTGRSNRRGGGV